MGVLFIHPRGGRFSADAKYINTGIYIGSELSVVALLTQLLV